MAVTLSFQGGQLRLFAKEIEPLGEFLLRVSFIGGRACIGLAADRSLTCAGEGGGGGVGVGASSTEQLLRAHMAFHADKQESLEDRTAAASSEPQLNETSTADDSCNESRELPADLWHRISEHASSMDDVWAITGTCR